MTISLVTQLRFTRSEFQRVLAGVSAENGVKRVMPMNSISWMVGHIANHEQVYWLVLAQNRLVKELTPLVGNGRPATTPPLGEMVTAWHEITEAADPFLDSLTSDQLSENWRYADGRVHGENVNTMFLRLIYHYWFHIGEIHAARQQLEGGDLPQFVGNMEMLQAVC